MYSLPETIGLRRVSGRNESTAKSSHPDCRWRAPGRRRNPL